MPSLKELSTREERLSRGHRLCPGCGASVIVRQVLLATEYPLIAASCTGCLEVATSIYPFTAWKIPWIHSAFENVAATLSGVETAYRHFKKLGKISKNIKFVAFGGDGGTYDIGIQSLSGVLERRHNMLYICYDNQAYMNTGIQRSSASPMGAHTTTSPPGQAVPLGKIEERKDLTRIVVAHGISYAAQASPGFYNDLMKKVEKALNTEGPTFINVLSPCPRGWRYKPELSMEIAKLATLSGAWPLYEVENGKYRITYKPGKKRKPAQDWLKSQGRFRHLFREENKELLEKVEKAIERREKELFARAGEEI